MDDRSQENHQEPLTERERELIQELARVIVREADLQLDPKKEAEEKHQQQLIEGGREHWKSQVDFFKHIATVSGASLVAVTALSGVIQPEENLAVALLHYGAYTFLGSSVAALFFLWMASNQLARFAWGEVRSEEVSVRNFDWPRVITYALFLLGLNFLAVAVLFGFYP